MARNWSSGDIVTATNLGSIERGVNAVSSMYEPTTWENGDVFTAEKLNNIEQGIENASNLWTVLTEESVTTITYEGDSYASGNITYVELITEDTIKITFNGMEYTCQNDSDGIMNHFGAPWSDELNGYDFSVCPFAISSIGIQDRARNTLYTETAGTYTIKIEAPQGGSSSDFSTAEVTVSLNSRYATYYGAMTGNYPGIGESTQDKISCEQGVNVITAVLYKGKALATFETDGTVNITGAARFASDHFTIIITGDCTITVSEPAVK